MFKLFACASALAISVATASTAQDDASDDDDEDVLEVITVTAQFREQSVTDVPLSITAYDGQFLESIGVDEFDELSNFVPGFSVQIQSVNNPGFVLRGITSDDGAATVEPRVSVFLNNVSIARARGSAVPLFDIERIEVLKGPQGTLFGRSAQVGAVHIITKKPGYELEGGVSAGVGNLGTFEANGFVNLPLVDDKAALRLAAFYQKRDGFIENKTGGDLNGKETLSFRGSLRFEPTEDLTIDLISNYIKDTPPGTSFKSGVIPALGGDVDPTTAASLNTFGGFQDDAPLGVNREVFDITGIVNYTINDAWAVTSTTAYRTFDSFENFDPDGTAFDLFIFAEDAKSDQLSTDIRFSYDSGDKVRGFFGGGIFYEDGSQSVPLGFDVGTTLALFGSVAAVSTPVDGQAFFGGSLPLAQAFLSGDPAVLNATLGFAGIPAGVFQEETFANFAENTSLDMFAEVEYDLTEKLTLTLGGRFTYDDKRSGFLSDITEINPLTNVLLGAPAIPNFRPLALLVGSSGGLQTNDETFSGFSWRAVLRYQLTDNASLYANYSRGRRPAVLEDDPVTDPITGIVDANFTVVDEERVDSYEIGGKGVFYDGKLSVDAAFYYLDYTNFQSNIQTTTDTGAPQFQLINAGSAHSVGFEAGMNYQVTPNLTLFGTYGWNRGRFNDFSDGAPQQFGGNQFRLSPDHSFSFGYHVEMPADYGTWFLTPTYTWRSKVFFEDQNQGAYTVINPADGSALFFVPEIAEDPVGLLNIRAGIRMMDDRLMIQGYVDNLFDKDYIIDGGNTGGSFGIPTFIAGAPLTIGGRISYRF